MDTCNLIKNTGGILKSILDNDLYKFTMQQAILHYFPTIWAKYRLFFRHESSFPIFLKQNLIENINSMQFLQLNTDEERFLKSLGFFTPDYIEYFKNYHYNPDFIKVYEKEGSCSVSG
jgi:nicotinate phosphoribosyltransferase